MKPYLHLIPLTAVFLSLSHLHAEDIKPEKVKKPKITAEEKFAKLDADSDGTISAEELNGEKLEKLRKKMEGKEGAEEKIAKMEEKLTASFAKKDKDGNGTLSLAEYAPPKKPKKEKAAKKPKAGDVDPANLNEMP